MRKNPFVYLVQGVIIFLIIPVTILFAEPSDGTGRTGADVPYTVPLAYVILSASDVEFVKPLVRPTDIIAAKPDRVELLGSLTGVQKLLLVSPGYERLSDGKWCAMSDEKMTSLIKKAKENGVTLFGYNLENSFHGKDIIKRERHVNELVHAAGMVHVFGPMVGRLMEQGGEEMVKAADVIVVQAQAFQRSTGFNTQKVLEIVKGLRESNPNAKVHIQISFINRDNGTYKTPGEVIEDLKMIAGSADTVWLFSGPRTSSLFREVFTKLRKTKDSSSLQSGVRTFQGVDIP
jgi:hypothetical protein